MQPNNKISICVINFYYDTKIYRRIPRLQEDIWKIYIFHLHGLPRKMIFTNN